MISNSHNNLQKLIALQSFDVSNISVADYVILSAAIQLGVFEWMQDKKIAFPDFTRKFSQYKEFARILLDALISFGYIQKDRNNNLSINPNCRKTLLGKGTIVLKNYDWYFLIAQAPSVIDHKLKPPLSDQTYNYFIDISEELSKLVLPIIHHDFPELFNLPKEVLDLGCGKMGLFRAIAKENPSLRVIGVDQNKYSLDFLNRKIKEEKLSKNIKIVKGNAVEKVGKLKDRYDFILLSHLVHWLTKKQIRATLKRCEKLLNEGGTCVIYEDYLDKSGLYPQSSVRKSLSLSVMGYQVFNEVELRELINKSGFKSITVKIVEDRRVLFYCS